MEIIAFVGKAGSGKDYQSKKLEEQGYIKIAFADILRQVTADICRISYNKMMEQYDSFKTTEYFPNYTGRQIMENIGSAIRKHDINFWVNAVINKIEKEHLNKVVISDMRYPNEYMKIYDFCAENEIEFKCIFCDYKSERYDANNPHESAKMSNYFSERGFKDLQTIGLKDIYDYIDSTKPIAQVF